MKYLQSNFSVVCGNLATQLRLCMFLSLSASEDDTAKQIILKEVLVSATSKVTFCKNILLFVFLRFFFSGFGQFQKHCLEYFVIASVLLDDVHMDNQV